jgi:tRNA threonylcarbamoyladenosine biosynthesis protein TsaB
VKDALLALAQSQGGPLLGLDTSAPQASLALVDPRAHEVLERALDAASLPSESVVSGIAALLEGAGYQVADLKALVVGLGPGSFTGLRVGLATAKGLALGGDVPLYGVSSMEVLACGAPAGPVAVVGDARRGDLYGALFHAGFEHRCQRLLGEQVVNLATFTRSVGHALGEIPGGLGSVHVVGDARKLVADAWGAPTSDAPLRIAYGILAAQARITAHAADDLTTLLPTYLRTSSVGR